MTKKKKLEEEKSNDCEALVRRLYSQSKIRAKKGEREWSLNLDQFVLLISKKCYYCGKAPYQKVKSPKTGKYWKRNGIDRVDNSAGYRTGNVVSCCKYCNRAKSDRNQKDFFEMVDLIYNKHIKDGELQK